MKKHVLLVLVGIAFIAPGCQTADKPDYPRLPAEFTGRKALSPLEEILSKAPNINWERKSRLNARTDYWTIPGEKPFYLFRDGAQFIDAESAFRYTRTSEGVELLTIEQKDALLKHPVCPTNAMSYTCEEDHTIIVATNITCGARACDYDFVVIDYTSKFRFLHDPPAIKTIINYMLDEEKEEYYFPYEYAADLIIKHRMSGNITNDNPLWLEYMRESFDLVQEKIDFAVANSDIRIIKARRGRQ